MIAFRKGRRCRIERIDRINDPPSCSVFMFDTESMVETEFSRLTLEDPKAEENQDVKSNIEEPKAANENIEKKQ